MERDVAEERPGKRMRGEQSDSSIENDSGFQSEASNAGDMTELDMEDKDVVLRAVWSVEDIIPADFLENLVCEARSKRMRDTELYEDYGGADDTTSTWRCCKNPLCYRCGIIDMTEMDIVHAEEKGITVQYIGVLKNTEEWRNMDITQRIGKIAQFLAFNRKERSELRISGGIRLNMAEAKRAIEQRLYFGSHFIVSPRTSTDKKFRFSATRVNMVGQKPGYKFFMRGDIRDTAAYFESMGFMEKLEATTYTKEGQLGTFREHPTEVAGTIVESIFGLGLVYEEFQYEELEDIPAIVEYMEAGLMTLDLKRRSDMRYQRNRFRATLTKEKWDEYDEIWGFAMIPENDANMLRNLDGLRNRQAGVPDQLEEDELAELYARMQRRKEARDRTLGQYAT
jgi:hypothetical protein